MKLLLLDCFCKAGGAAMGYSRAGFQVIGVDIEPQPRYPFGFIRADAVEFIDMWGSQFDAIHASPPCQAFTSILNIHPAEVRARHKDLIAPTRSALERTGRPYVIENVPGSPLKDYIVLCGTMFGLGTPCGAELWRHRWFEVNWPIGLIPPCMHSRARRITVCGTGAPNRQDRRRVITVAGRGQPLPLQRRVISVTGSTAQRQVDHNERRETFSAAYTRIAMGIDWMRRDEISQAIPPAYTELIGRRLLEEIAYRSVEAVV